MKVTRDIFEWNSLREKWMPNWCQRPEKHHKDKAEYLTMFWLKFEDDTPKNVVSVSFYLKKSRRPFKKAIWRLQMDTW